MKIGLNSKHTEDYYCSTNFDWVCKFYKSKAFTFVWAYYDDLKS